MSKFLFKKFMCKAKKTAQSLVEYSLILALVSVVAITFLQLLGREVKIHVQYLSNRLQQANEISSQLST